MTFKNINIYFSSECKGNCIYCYLPDKHILSQHNNEIQNWIKTNQYLLDIQKFSENNLEILGFWGAEPLININLLDTDKLISSFPKLHQITFSTSFSKININNFINFIKKLNNSKKLYPQPFLKLGIQISFDGSEELNDFSRNKGTTKRLLNNLDFFVNTFNEIEFKNLSITFSSSNTIDSSMLDFLAENIDSQHKYFNDLNILYKNKNKNKNINFNFIFTTKMAGSVSYTKNDGIKYALLQKHEIENNKKIA